jgi:hypothetical protein
MAIRGDYFTEGKVNFNAGAYLQIVAGCQLPVTILIRLA